MAIILLHTASKVYTNRCTKLYIAVLIRLKLATFKGNHRPYRSNATSLRVTWVLLFWPRWPAAVDRSQLLDERILGNAIRCAISADLKMVARNRPVVSSRIILEEVNLSFYLYSNVLSLLLFLSSLLNPGPWATFRKWHAVVFVKANILLELNWPHYQPLTLFADLDIKYSFNVANKVIA